MTRAGLRRAALRILRAGLAAVEPGRLLAAHLAKADGDVRIAGETLRPRRLFVVAVGKAAAPMARTAHRILGRRLTSAIVIAPAKVPRLPRTRGFVSGHPVPDAAGVRAGRAVIDLLGGCEEGDVVLLLLSGGASSLMPAPRAGVSLAEKQRVTRVLLRRGATILEMNAVRKCLSRLKGGGFARLAAPARVVTLAISDVPGDDPATIGSGPTVHDPGAPALARRTVRTYLRASEAPRGAARIFVPRTADDGIPAGTRTVVIGGGRTFAEAAGEEAKRLGFRVHLRPGTLQGEARACGPMLVARFKALRRPACLIATGETVVDVRGGGRGGRNQELALSSAGALARLGRPTALAALATDGVDGPTDAAGGLVDDQTAGLARRLRLSVQRALDNNDSGSAVARVGGLIVTGPTGTNVADVTVLVG